MEQLIIQLIDSIGTTSAFIIILLFQLLCIFLTVKCLFTIGGHRLVQCPVRLQHILSVVFIFILQLGISFLAKVLLTY
ncbi:MAG: hypothetical protein R3Y54_06080 [Eubacteriales bacterium]